MIVAAREWAVLVMFLCCIACVNRQRISDYVRFWRARRARHALLARVRRTNKLRRRAAAVHRAALRSVNAGAPQCPWDGAIVRQPRYYVTRWHRDVASAYRELPRF